MTVRQANAAWRRVLVAGALAVLAGCGSATQLTNMWADPQYSAGPMHSILVVAMRNGPARRRIMEDAYASQLDRHGVDVTPSYQRFPNAVPDTDQIERVVEERRFDGVLMISPLPTERQTVYVPGYVTTQPVYAYNPWSGFYHERWVYVHHPGYREQQRTVRHEIDLWDTGPNGHLVWTAIGESIDPNSVSEVSNEVARRVVPELQRRGLIGR